MIERRRGAFPVAVLIAAVSGGLVASSAASAASAVSAAAGSAVLSDADIAAMSMAEQNQLLDPLRRVASALTIATKSAARDTFAGIAIDGGHQVVNLYVTNIVAGRALAASVVAEPDVQYVRVLPAKFTQDASIAAANRLMKSDRAAAIAGLALAPDGNGLVATIDSDFSPTSTGSRAPDMSAAALSAVAGVDTATTAGHRMRPASRQNDQSPFKAGSPMYNGGAVCTMGFSARGSSGDAYIFTASHCGHSGTFMTGVGPRSNSVTVGTIGSYNTTLDAAAVKIAPGKSSIGRLWYGSSVGSVTNVLSMSTNAVGDYVCQDGWTSAVATGHGVCNIKIDKQIVQQPWSDSYGNHVLNGWSAQKIGGDQIAARGGDSGALVYVGDTTGVSARGIVSLAGGSGMGFSDGFGIQNYFNMTLAPTCC